MSRGACFFFFNDSFQYCTLSVGIVFVRFARLSLGNPIHLLAHFYLIIVS